jgi:hypothetical protein
MLVYGNYMEISCIVHSQALRERVMAHSTVETHRFIKESRYALDHLFEALVHYQKVVTSSEESLKKIEETKFVLSSIFEHRDQWSPHANNYLAQYMELLKGLEAQKSQLQRDTQVRLSEVLASIESSIESMSALAATVLQISKQVLAYRYGTKPMVASARTIGSQSIVEVIWEG